MKTAGTMIVILVSVLVLSACSGGQEPTGRKAESVAPVKGITVEQAAVSAVPETIVVVGTVRSSVSAAVTARVAGTLSLLKVREGDRVVKGQLLARLDAQENQAGSTMALEGVEEARRSLDEALSRKKLADSTFSRYEVLFKEQVITRQEFETKQTERELAAQGAARAEARLRQAGANAKAAGTLADYTNIVAPISGIITSRQANLGSTVFPAQPLMTIDDEGSYQLELSIPESLAGRVKPGATVQVTLDTAGVPFTAKISAVVPAADPASRTFKAKVPLQQKGLKSGLFGRGAILTGTSVSGITVKKSAVVERGFMSMLWVLDQDSRARLRLVKAGKVIDDRVEILSGLSDGERIAVSGLEKLAEGAKVE